MRQPRCEKSELIVAADRAAIISHVHVVNSAIEREAVRVIPDVRNELIDKLHIIGIEKHFYGAVRQI